MATDPVITPALGDEKLVEAIARAMCRERHPCWSIVSEIFERDHDGQATEFRDFARAALAVARPAIMEECARVALGEDASATEYYRGRVHAAAAIRAME